MKRKGINPTLYSHYLLSSFDNYTGSHLAEVIECIHDVMIIRFAFPNEEILNVEGERGERK